MTNIVDVCEVRKGQFVVSFNCDFCGILSADRKSHFDRKKNHYCSKACYSEDRKTWPKDMQHRYGTGMSLTERKRRAKIRSITNKAISSGKLKRCACEVCGEAAEAHHNEYCNENPLNVRWLCFSHHRQWHKENPELLNEG